VPKPAAARRIAGSSAPRIDLPDKLFGAARFLHDLRLPGMLHARMVRPPSRGARLLDLRDGALPGGATVFRDGSVLAAVDAQEHHAEAAAERLARRATWEERDTLPEDSALEAWLRAAPRDSSVVAERVADTPPAAHRVSAAFFRPFLAHGSIGPSCAVARWDGAALEVWSHSQGIYNLRTDLAKALRVPPEAILVRHVEGAGCYGHNGADDVALDAALVARAHPGRPVRVLWSRADGARLVPLLARHAGRGGRGRRCRWHAAVVAARRDLQRTFRAAGARQGPDAARRLDDRGRLSRAALDQSRRWPAAAVRSAMPCRPTACRPCMSACTRCARCRSAPARCAGSARWSMSGRSRA
jgi:CO/xanthine dehydrogenase Mo-binding subunit